MELKKLSVLRMNWERVNLYKIVIKVIYHVQTFKECAKVNRKTPATVMAGVFVMMVIAYATNIGSVMIVQERLKEKRKSRKDLILDNYCCIS